MMGEKTSCNFPFRYPEKLKSGLHRAHCFIPAGIAVVLAQRPHLVAHAVSAFYLRDPVDLQACRSFKTFPPETRVLTSVKTRCHAFTRQKNLKCLWPHCNLVLTCMLFTCRWHSRAVCMHSCCSSRSLQTVGAVSRCLLTLTPSSEPMSLAWNSWAAWSVTHLVKPSVTGSCNAMFVWPFPSQAHGFEILCSRCRPPSSEPGAPISCNPQWKSFLESLKSNDYFRVCLFECWWHMEG